MSNFRLMLLSTAAAGLVAVAVSPASAAEVEKSMSVSGHVNRVIIVTDDGENTTVGQNDNGQVSQSRFRIKGSAKSESMTISTLTEIGLGGNRFVDNQADASSTGITLRHSAISIGNGMGTLTVGHTSTAGAYFEGNNLGGTGNSGFHDGSVISGQLLHTKNDTGTVTSTVSVGSVATQFTGGGNRHTNVRFDTNNMGGFSAAVGYSEDDHAAGGVKYSGDFDGTKVIASVGWQSEGSTSAIDNRWGGSVAVKLAGGIDLALGYSKRDLNNNVAGNTGLDDPTHWGAAIGYTMGANAIQAQYGVTNDLGANNNEATLMQLVVEHRMNEYGTSIYGGISNVDYDTASTATQYDDLTGGWVGIKVSF